MNVDCNGHYLQENIMQLGQTKLALDEAVAGEDNDKIEKVMKDSLMNTLRKQLLENDE